MELSSQKIQTGKQICLMTSAQIIMARKPKVTDVAQPKSCYICLLLIKALGCLTRLHGNYYKCKLQEKSYLIEMTYQIEYANPLSKNLVIRIGTFRLMILNIWPRSYSLSNYSFTQQVQVG